MFVKKAKNLFSYKSLTLLVLLFLELNVLCEGFIAGTLVKTQNGYVPIEQLKENDCITSYNFKEKNLTCGKILKTTKKHYDKCIKLTINGQEIIAAPDHKFFCPLKKGCWIKAQDIEKNDFVLKEVKELVRIDDAVKLDQENDFYCLSIESNHNFFVSNQDILVHNILIVAYVIGQGFVYAGAAEWIALGLGLTIALIAKKKGWDTSNFHPCDINRPSRNDLEHWHGAKNRKKHGFDGKDPKKIWELAELAIIAGCRCRRDIQEGVVQTYQIAVDACETLEVKGVFIKDKFHVGTMYIKEAFDLWRNS